MYNAKVLESKNAAKIIKNEELNSVNLNESIKEIVLNKNKKMEMGKNASKIATKNVEDKIYKEILELVKSNKQ